MTALLLLLLAAGCTGPTPDRACFAQVTRALTAPAMEGRLVGTRGSARAADRIHAEMRAQGLRVAHQRLDVPRHVQVGTYLTAGAPTSFEATRWSSAGAFAGPLAIADPEALSSGGEQGDLEGRVVLASASQPAPLPMPRRASDPTRLAAKASAHGAVALLLAHPDDDWFRPPAALIARADLPVIRVTHAWVDEVIGLSRFETAQNGLGGRPVDAGIALEGRVELDIDATPATNVIGALPGAGALADQAVVVGAHYDGAQGAPYQGADDNASGVAAMLCAVRGLAPPAPRRTLVVAAFDAEESILVGSRHYVDEPLYALADTVAMVNLDMVGRVREGRLRAHGALEDRAWIDPLRAAAPRGLTVVPASRKSLGASDHVVFRSRGVPSVHLFSGRHPQYHTARDTFDRLNLRGGGQVTALTRDLLAELLTTDDLALSAPERAPGIPRRVASPRSPAR